MSDLIKGLHDQIIRNKELLTMYEETPTGIFGAHFIRQSIQDGEEALESGDAIKMIFAYKRLQENE